MIRTLSFFASAKVIHYFGTAKQISHFFKDWLQKTPNKCSLNSQPSILLITTGLNRFPTAIKERCYLRC